jgi:hypothetical protein
VVAATRVGLPGAGPNGGGPGSWVKRAASILARRAARPADQVQQLSGAACNVDAVAGRKGFPATAQGISAHGSGSRRSLRLGIFARRGLVVLRWPNAPMPGHERGAALEQRRVGHGLVSRRRPGQIPQTLSAS